MSALVWSVEWKLATADRRGIALRILGALALAVVIATGALPNGSGSAAFAALFVGYGLLRSAMSIVRDSRSGLARRVLGGGIGPSSYLLQRAAATAGLSLVELVPALAVLALFAGASVASVLVALATVLVSLWIACVLGVVVGTISKTATEALILNGVALILLLHMSGVFSSPEPDGLGAFLEAASPFCALHEALLVMGTGGAIEGATAAAAWTVLLPVAVGLFAPRLTVFSSAA